MEKTILTTLKALIIFFLLSNKLNAQNFIWANQIQNIGYGNGSTYGISTDINKNVYAVGNFSTTPYTAFIQKIDSIGEISWGYYFGGSSSSNSATPKSIAIDENNNIYVLGTFKGSVNFDPINNFTLTGNTSGYTTVFICKIDAYGNFVWAEAINGDNNSEAFSIKYLKDNLYITGYFVGAHDFDPTQLGVYTLSTSATTSSYLAKFDAITGNLVWADKFSESTGTSSSQEVALDTLGNLVVCGSFSGTADFDPTINTLNLTSSGNSDGFFAKFDTSGVFYWANKLGNGGADNINDIDLTLGGKIILTGSFSDTVDFDQSGNSFEIISLGSTDGFIAEYNLNGAFVYAGSFGGNSTDAGTALVLDGNSSIYITGYFKNTADFDLSSGIQNLTSAGLEDIFIAKYKSNSILEWVKSINGTQLDKPSDISIDDLNSVYITGTFSYQNVDFDPSANNYFMSAGSTFIHKDGFILKLGCTLNLNLGQDVSICDSTYTLNTNITGGNYQWSTGDTTISTIITNSNFYSLSVNLEGCLAVDTIYIELKEIPIVTIQQMVNDSVLCSGDTLSLLANGANTYSWNNGILNNTPFQIYSPTTYSVVGYALNGCSNTTSINLTPSPTPILNLTSSQVNGTICFNDSIFLDAYSDGMITWNQPILDSIFFVPQNSDTYSAIAVNSSGCKTYNDISIIVNPLPTITFDLTSDTLCTNSISLDLTQFGNPTNGIFSGLNVSGSLFTPTNQNLGYTNITYVYTDNNGCTNNAIDSIYTDLCTYISANKITNNLITFPNPVTDKFNVIFSCSSEESIAFEIVTIDGKRMTLQTIQPQNNSTVSFDCSNFPNGVYLYSIIKNSTPIENGRFIVVK